MRVQPSVKKICRNCKVIRRNRVVRVICTDPRHKQRLICFKIKICYVCVAFRLKGNEEWLVLQE